MAQPKQKIMNQERIKSGNEIIARFMGHKFPKDKEIGVSRKRSSCIRTEHKYHSSWDSLMPVYKKLSSELKKMSKEIQSDKKRSWTSKHSRLKHIDDCDAVIRCHIWGVRIKDSWNGIVETIRLYDGLFIKKTKTKC